MKRMRHEFERALRRRAGLRRAGSLKVSLCSVARDENDRVSRTRITRRAPPSALRSGWPRALLLGVGTCLLATFACWGLARFHFATTQRRLLIVGDSVISNYRPAPGGRVEDVVQKELGPSWSVQNFAESGSRIADYYLLLTKAELLGFAPDVVVVELNPSKLLREFDSGPDLDEDGRGLMWLPLNSEGVEYLATQSPHFLDVLPLRKASLLFAFYEGVRAVWLSQINWPSRRRKMADEAVLARQHRMRQQAIARGREWSSNVHPQTYAEFRASRQVLTLDFLLAAVVQRHAKIVLFLPPWPNQGVATEALTENGRGVLMQTREYLLRHCAEGHVPVVALDDPQMLQTFTKNDWDDFEHLRSAHAYLAMGQAIANGVSAAAN